MDLASDVWKVNNTEYVVPILNFAYPMYVNMDILEKSGVEKIPTTWSELEEACGKIKAAGYSAFALILEPQMQMNSKCIYGHRLGIRNYIKG